ncbi:MAG: hypothetical protein AB7K52_03455 [Phycisphaerales bacterium]
MNSRRAITLGIALVSASAALVAISTAFMARRVAAYYEANPPPRHIFHQIKDRRFRIWDRQIELTDARTPEGAPALRVSIDAEPYLLPCHAPKVQNLPDLGGYDDWVAVATFAPLEQGEVQRDPMGPGHELRLVVVSRNAAPGHDDDMGGLVGRKFWTFDFVELRPDQTFTRRVLQFPAYKYTSGKKYLPALEADPQADVEPIAERSWEFQAALLAIPKLHVSNYRYRTTGVSAMGWTLPGAGFGVMGIIAGIVLWQGGRIGRARPVPSA